MNKYFFLKSNLCLLSNIWSLSLLCDPSKTWPMMRRAVFLLAHIRESWDWSILTWYSRIMTERVTHALNAPAFFRCLFCLFSSVPCLAGHRPTVGTRTCRSNCILLCWDGGIPLFLHCTIMMHQLPLEEFFLSSLNVNVIGLYLHTHTHIPLTFSFTLISVLGHIVDLSLFY